MEIRWLGEALRSGGSVKYVALSPPAEEEDILATGILARVDSQGGNWGSVSGQFRRKRLNRPMGLLVLRHRGW